MTWVYLDGEIVPEGEAKVSVNDRALLHGRGVFETFRARRGRPVYRLAQHLERLEAGINLLGMGLPALGDCEEKVQALVDRCALDDARVRLTVTAGPGEPAGSRGSVLIQTRAATDYPAEVYETGVSAVVATVRRNETSPLARVKVLNWLDNALAREAARRGGADEALLLNTSGLVAEGAATNVFIVRGDELATPPMKDGALPGVTRAAVLEIASDAGIPAREGSITLADVASASEAFLTNAIAGVLPLVAVDGATIAEGAPGELTRRLMALYQRAAAGGDGPATPRGGLYRAGPSGEPRSGS